MTDPPAIETLAGRSPLLRAALEMARDAHAGQTRNASGGRPYVDHVVSVAVILSELLPDDEVLAAALTHDVVEDSEFGIADVRDRCGERVAELVEALTDNEALEPYEARKREHRGRVEAAGREAVAIYAADKLVNVKMLRDAYREKGEGVAAELKVSLDEKVRIWQDDLEMLRSNEAESPAVSTLAAGLDEQLRGLAEDRALPSPR